VSLKRHYTDTICHNDGCHLKKYTNKRRAELTGTAKRLLLLLMSVRLTSKATQVDGVANVVVTRMILSIFEITTHYN